MKKRRLFDIIYAGLLFSFVSIQESSALHHFVAKSGSSVSPYSSWSTAATNIADAINACLTGENVFVDDGVFRLTSSLVLTNRITLQSVNGCASTILDGGNNSRCVYLSAGSTIDGFTLRNGYASEGGGAYLHEGGTILNCNIVSNRAICNPGMGGGGVATYYGGSILNCDISYNLAKGTNSFSGGDFFYGGGILLYNGGTAQLCRVYGNMTTSTNCDPSGTYYCKGGGIHLENSGLIEACDIRNNSIFAKNAAEGGGVFMDEGGRMQNCVIADNRIVADGSTYAAAQGGGVHCNLGGLVLNCTISGNSAAGFYTGEGGGVYFFRGGDVENSIMYYNNAMTGNNWATNAAGQSVSFSCTVPPFPGTDNIVFAPAYVDGLNGDFHLRAISPCIDRGRSNSLVRFDIEGRHRPINGSGSGGAEYDMGAYEYAPNATTAPTPVSATENIFWNKIALNWSPCIGTQSYEVWRSRSPNALNANRIASGITTTNYDDTNTTPGFSYYYWVKKAETPFSEVEMGFKRIAKADFDRDGITDIGCYNDSGGDWYVYKSSDGYWYTQFGYSGTTPVVGDFDKDGYCDFGCYFASSGNWYFYMSLQGFQTTQYGYAATLPITGDFDGDGIWDYGCYYPDSGTWNIMKSTTGSDSTQFGYSGTLPITGDFDSDGLCDFGCYYPASGDWYIFKSSQGFWQTQFGYEGTIPITGDFDGDGICDFGCYYDASGHWYIYKSSEGFWQTQFGYEGTIPITGDFDGDGKSDFGCYYDLSGDWYVYKSTSGFWQTQFGYEGTVPIAQ